MPVRLASNETIPLPSVLTYIAPLQDFDEEDDFELPPLPDWLIKHSYHSVDLKVDSSMSLIAIRSLANVLVLIVDDVWEDKERACVVLGQVLTHLMPLLDSYGIADLLHKQAASVVLSTLAISKFQYSLKAWRKEAWGLFLKPDFFLTDLPCLQHWRFIVSRAVQSEFSLFSDLLSRSSGSQARLFQTQKAALVERARQLKRLSFIIHAGRLDQYARYLVQILELLVEGLKIPQATELHVQILLCIRVLLTRLSPEHLVAIWPVVLTEIIRAFEDASDLDLLLQACKFVDLALVLLPSQFQLYQWMFIADRAAQDEIEARHLTPNSENEFTSFIPHLLFLSRRVQRANPSSESNTSSQSHVRKSSVLVVPDDKTGRLMRRPVLTMRRISNAQELASFHDTVAEWVATESGTGSRSPPDIEFIDNLIICDFIEYGEEYKDPISSQFSFIRKVDIPGNLDDRKTGYIDEEDDSNSL